MKTKITLITNINFIQIDGLRLECHALLIESDEKSIFGDGATHKIRGFGTSGCASIFTQWLADGSFTLIPAESINTVVMGESGNASPLFSGATLTIDGRDYFLQIEDRNHPFDELDVTNADYGVIWDTLARKVEQYWNAPNMPRNYWSPPRKASGTHAAAGRDE